MKPTAKTTATLPEGYGVIHTVDLKNNKKQFWTVNLLSAAMAVILIWPAMYFVPFHTLFEGEPLEMLARMAVLAVSLVAYVALHELVHGIFMKGFSGVKPHYGISWTYAYAGSKAFFNRRHYVIIALAPVVIWGVVLAVVTPLVSPAWFWVPYFIQIMNLSGAAGDLYVTARMSRMPADILVQDSGVAMTVYGRPNSE